MSETHERDHVVSGGVDSYTHPGLKLGLAREVCKCCEVEEAKLRITKGILLVEPDHDPSSIVWEEVISADLYEKRRVLEAEAGVEDVRVHEVAHQCGPLVQPMIDLAGRLR